MTTTAGSSCTSRPTFSQPQRAVARSLSARRYRPATTVGDVEGATIVALYTEMIEEDRREARIRAEAAHRNGLVGRQDEVQANKREEEGVEESALSNVGASRRPATAPAFNAPRSYSARQTRPPLREYSHNTADINAQRIATAVGRRPATASPGIRFFRGTGSGRLLGEGYDAGVSASVQTATAVLDTETRLTAAPDEMADACSVPRSPSPPRRRGSSCSSRQSCKARGGQASARTGASPRRTSSVTLTYCCATGCGGQTITHMI